MSDFVYRDITSDITEKCNTCLFHCKNKYTFVHFVDNMKRIWKSPSLTKVNKQIVSANGGYVMGAKPRWTSEQCLARVET